MESGYFQRIAERVAQGGHYVPAEDVRRRYFRGLSNLEQVLADARQRDGVARSSVECSVMELEPRGYIVLPFQWNNQKWEDSVGESKASTHPGMAER
jgi:predicted ABC-type ATPase